MNLSAVIQRSTRPATVRGAASLAVVPVKLWPAGAVVADMSAVTAQSAGFPATGAGHDAFASSMFTRTARANINLAVTANDTNSPAMDRPPRRAPA